MTQRYIWIVMISAFIGQQFVSITKLPGISYNKQIRLWLAVINERHCELIQKLTFVIGNKVILGQ